ERTSQKPVVVAAPQPTVAEIFKQHGIPVFSTENRAIACLSQVIRHQALQEVSARRRVDSLYRERAASGRKAEGTRPIMLNEADSLTRLEKLGVPTVQFQLCSTHEQAEQAFHEIGAPVVVKGCSATVAHKSELGLVHLDINDVDQLRRAFDEVQQVLSAAGESFDGVIVAKKVQGRHELMIGALRDPVLGPFVMLADGGKYVEVLPDVQILMPPFDHDDVQARLERLRVYPLFAGV